MTKDNIYIVIYLIMETSVEQDQLKNFDSYRSALDRFIWFKDVDLVIDEDAKTCYFAPWEKKVGVLWRWEKREEKRALTEEEYRQMQWRGEFSPVILTDKKIWKELRDKDWKLLVKINEVYAKRKSDIKESVGKLFQNLFADSLKSK